MAERRTHLVDLTGTLDGWRLTECGRKAAKDGIARVALVDANPTCRLCRKVRK